MTVPVLTVVQTDASRWAGQINAAWRSSVEGILETGHLLRKAKEDLGHGNFLKMVEDHLQFSPAMAQRLMKISADRKLTNTEHVPHLPAAWGTLYELQKLGWKQFRLAIVEEAINPSMTRAEAIALRRPPAAEPTENPRDVFSKKMAAFALRDDRDGAVGLMADTLRGMGYGRGIDIYESIL